MEYNGLTIKERIVQSERGDVVAYEIFSKEGYILGIYGTIERAKKIIDRNGKRWIASR